MPSTRNQRRALLTTAFGVIAVAAMFVMPARANGLTPATLAAAAIGYFECLRI